VPSEDPLLNGDFGEQYTRGIQTGEDARFIKTGEFGAPPRKTSAPLK
jgi:hypothetical protein